MPRILAPNQSFQRRGSQHSFSSRTSLNSEPPLRRNSLTRGYQHAAYESAFSLRRKGDSHRHRISYHVHDGRKHDVTQQVKQNAQWDLQDPRQIPHKTLSKESFNTAASTQASSQSSSDSTLPSTIATSASGLAAAFALLMQQKAGVGAATNKSSESQSVPCSPNPPSKPTSTFSSSLDPYHNMIREEPDCWGQFVDVQAAAEDLERRSRVIRRYPGAPNSLPRY